MWAATGSRPTAPRDLGFDSAYLFGAVCPALGKAAAIVMPRANTWAMNLHLEEISYHVASDSHAIMFMDNAAWHSSKALRVPENLTPLPLPPYSPELNPVERVWKYLRSHKISNRTFKDYIEVLDVCVDAWNDFAADPALITSLCHVDWADSVN